MAGALQHELLSLVLEILKQPAGRSKIPDLLAFEYRSRHLKRKRTRQPVLRREQRFEGERLYSCFIHQQPRRQTACQKRLPPHPPTADCAHKFLRRPSQKYDRRCQPICLPRLLSSSMWARGLKGRAPGGHYSFQRRFSRQSRSDRPPVTTTAAQLIHIGTTLIPTVISTPNTALIR